MENPFYIYTKNHDFIRLDHGDGSMLEAEDEKEGFVDYYNYDVLRNVKEEDILDIIWKDANAEKCFDEYENADGGMWMIDSVEAYRLDPDQIKTHREEFVATDLLNSMADDFPAEPRWHEWDFKVFNEDEKELTDPKFMAGLIAAGVKEKAFHSKRLTPFFEGKDKINTFVISEDDKDIAKMFISSRGILDLCPLDNDGKAIVMSYDEGDKDVAEMMEKTDGIRSIYDALFEYRMSFRLFSGMAQEEYYNKASHMLNEKNISLGSEDLAHMIDSFMEEAEHDSVLAQIKPGTPLMERALSEKLEEKINDLSSGISVDDSLDSDYDGEER